MQVTVEEIDGVRVVRTDVPGPLRATLTVRVGRADETLPTSGVTHMLEHLALFEAGRPGDHGNGYVDLSGMVFTTEGRPEEVVDFLGKVTTGLSRPPVQRLALERDVLAAEQARKSGSLAQDLLLWRYGATGYGLGGYREFGAARLTADDVTAWAQTYAVRGNAVLTLSGPPPAGLRLHLPEGGFRPPPDPRADLLSGRPAWFTGQEDAAGLDLLVPRSAVARALREIAEHRLVDELRVRRAIAYSPWADQLSLTADHALLVLATDLLAGRAAEGVRPFLQVLERLALPPGEDGAVTEAEIAGFRANSERMRAHPLSGLGVLAASADRVLYGGTAKDMDSLAAEWEAVGPEDVAGAAREGLASALAVVPQGLGPWWEPWGPVPDTTPPPVEGAQYRGRDQHNHTERLVLGGAGISWQGDGRHRTVEAGSTAAVLRWPDGRRVLIGADATEIVVEPALWQDGERLVAEIDRLWSRDVVPMPARVASAVPVARPVAPDQEDPGAKPRTRRARVVAAVLLLIFAANVVRLVKDQGALAVPVLLVVLGAGAAVVLAVGAVRSRLSRSRRPGTAR